jgi:peptide/nickel transport system permease protein
MLDVLNMDYVTCAKAKGLSSMNVIIKHALRNALIPFLTISGLALGDLLGGSIIIEEMFAWPGIGKLLVESIQQRDLPITQGCVLFLAIGYVTVNLLVDVFYAVLDPRIQLEKSKA